MGSILVCRIYKYIYTHIESKDTKKCMCIHIHIKVYASLCLVWKSSFPHSSVQQKVAPPNNEKILKRRICVMGPSSSKVVGTWCWCIYQCQFLNGITATVYIYICISTWCSTNLIRFGRVTLQSHQLSYFHQVCMVSNYQLLRFLPGTCWEQSKLAHKQLPLLNH